MSEETTDQPGVGEEINDGYDALRKMLHGISSETVGLWLIEAGYWPEHLTMGAAAARVRACINPKGDQFFKFAEIIFLQWKTGRHHPLFYACDCLGRHRPTPRNITREFIQLQEEVVSLEAALVAKKRKLAALGTDESPLTKADEEGRTLRFKRDDQDNGES